MSKKEKIDFLKFQKENLSEEELKKIYGGDATENNNKNSGNSNSSDKEDYLNEQIPGEEFNISGRASKKKRGINYYNKASVSKDNNLNNNNMNYEKPPSKEPKPEDNKNIPQEGNFEINEDVLEKLEHWQHNKTALKDNQGNKCYVLKFEYVPQNNWVKVQIVGGKKRQNILKCDELYELNKDLTNKDYEQKPKEKRILDDQDQPKNQPKIEQSEPEKEIADKLCEIKEMIEKDIKEEIRNAAFAIYKIRDKEGRISTPEEEKEDWYEAEEKINKLISIIENLGEEGVELEVENYLDNLRDKDNPEIKRGIVELLEDFLDKIKTGEEQTLESETEPETGKTEEEISDIKEVETKPTEEEPQETEEEKQQREQKEKNLETVEETLAEFQNIRDRASARLSEILEENNEIKRRYLMGEKLSEEEKKRAREILALEDLKNTASLNVFMSELALSSFEKDSRKRMETAIYVERNVRAVVGQYDLMLKEQQIELNKRELAGEKEEAVKKFEGTVGKKGIFETMADKFWKKEKSARVNETKEDKETNKGQITLSDYKVEETKEEKSSKENQQGKKDVEKEESSRERQEKLVDLLRKGDKALYEAWKNGEFSYKEIENGIVGVDGSLIMPATTWKEFLTLEELEKVKNEEDNPEKVKELEKIIEKPEVVELYSSIRRFIEDIKDKNIDFDLHYEGVAARKITEMNGIEYKLTDSQKIRHRELLRELKRVYEGLQNKREFAERKFVEEKEKELEKELEKLYGMESLKNVKPNKKDIEKFIKGLNNSLKEKETEIYNSLKERNLISGYAYSALLGDIKNITLLLAREGDRSLKLEEYFKIVDSSDSVKKKKERIEKKLNKNKNFIQEVIESKQTREFLEELLNKIEEYCNESLK